MFMTHRSKHFLTLLFPRTENSWSLSRTALNYAECKNRGNFFVCVCVFNRAKTNDSALYQTALSIIKLWMQFANLAKFAKFFMFVYKEWWNWIVKIKTVKLENLIGSIFKKEATKFLLSLRLKTPPPSSTPNQGAFIERSSAPLS